MRLDSRIVRANEPEEAGLRWRLLADVAIIMLDSSWTVGLERRPAVVTQQQAAAVLRARKIVWHGEKKGAPQKLDQLGWLSIQGTSRLEEAATVGGR